MRTKLSFLNIDFLQFQQRFPDDKACYLFLVKSKWPQGFRCERCNNHKYCPGKHSRAIQCTLCRYQASPTSGTIFHKLKFPLIKAFLIIYYMGTNKRWVSAAMMSRMLALDRRACALFQNKVLQARRRGEIRLPSTYLHTDLTTQTEERRTEAISLPLQRTQQQPGRELNNAYRIR